MREPMAARKGAFTNMPNILREGIAGRFIPSGDSTAANAATCHFESDRLEWEGDVKSVLHGGGWICSVDFRSGNCHANQIQVTTEVQRTKQDNRITIFAMAKKELLQA
jgi:hypothetical protein